LLSAIFVSLWYLKINTLIGFSEAFIIFEDLCNWMLVYGLAYLMACSVPRWLKKTDSADRLQLSTH
jgi:hypothetical protein